MPDKNIVDVIQSLLEKNKGFMTVKRLVASIGLDGKRELGIRNGESGKVIRRKIEQSAGDRFMFKMKGRSIYILEPCEPSEFVLGLLSEKKAFDTRMLNSLPFTKAEFASVVNELAAEGRVKVLLTDKFAPKIYSLKAEVMAESHETLSEAAADEGEYTQEKFREAFDALDRGRVFVLIPALRRKLSWPREIFDNMLKTLRDNDTIQLHTGDASLMTPDEVADCFTDENGFRKGSVTWHVR